MIVRPAISADIVSIMPFARQINELHNYYKPFNAEWKESDLQFKISDAEWAVFVAENDENSVVGYAVCARSELPFIKSWRLKIIEIFVDVSFRRKGVGAALLQSMLCSFKNYETVEADIMLSNSASKALFKAAGFSLRSEVYWKRSSSIAHNQSC